MQRLYPDPGDEPLEGVYADVAGGSDRWLALGMVASVDGAATVDGVSSGLGQDGDQAAFRALRAVADLILVGAGTIRAERYGPPKAAAEVLAARRERGQADRAGIAVVSRSLDLDLGGRLFTEDSAWRPLVVTSRAADPDRVTALEEAGAELIVAGDDLVDLSAAIERLRTLGYGRILGEGGPSLNGQLLAYGLVDEIFLTVAPSLVGGSAARIVTGPSASPTSMDLLGVRRHGNEVLLRYRVAR